MPLEIFTTPYAFLVLGVSALSSYCGIDPAFPTSLLW